MKSKKADLRKKIINCLFLDRQTTGAIEDLEKLISQEIKRAEKKMADALDIITLDALLLNDHPAEKIVRKQINKIRQDINNYLERGK